MLNVIKRLFKEEEGQGMVEYGILIALISVIVIASVGLLGRYIKGLFDDVKTTLENETTVTD